MKLVKEGGRHAVRKGCRPLGEIIKGSTEERGKCSEAGRDARMKAGTKPHSLCLTP